jgi:methylase of polypeptide subunit release factors
VLDLGTGTGIWAMCASSRCCSEGFPWLTFKQ